MGRVIRFLKKHLDTIWIIIGIVIGIFFIFLSLYLCTQPYWYKSFDFSASGQVGDTIGGITAPIINIVGAVLVYISFKAQINANRINFKALKDERISSNKESIYQKHISQFSDIKNRVDNLEFIIQFDRTYNGQFTDQPTPIGYKGLNALHECILRVKDKINKTRHYQREGFETYSVLLNYDYILISLNELAESAENKIKDKSDKEFLLNNIGTFYMKLLRTFGDTLVHTYRQDVMHSMSGDLLDDLMKPLDEKFRKFGLLK